MTERAIKKSNKIAALAIILGIILYLSKFLRPYFHDNHSMLATGYGKENK